MGEYLQKLAKSADTHGQYQRVGEVYGFPVLVYSEKTFVDGVESRQNRFVVDCGLKYKHNNGYIAMSDTHAACMNFANALERLPDTISQFEKRAEKMRADIPQLQTIVAKTWGKEDELKALKSDLAALDRKISAEIAPKEEDTTDGEEIKRDQQQQPANIVVTSYSPDKSQNSKESMVAEPRQQYQSPLPVPLPKYRPSGI